MWRSSINAQLMCQLWDVDSSHRFCNKVSNIYNLHCMLLRVVPFHIASSHRHNNAVMHRQVHCWMEDPGAKCHSDEERALAGGGWSP